MTTTQVKVGAGSFNAVTLDTAARTSPADANIGALSPGAKLNMLQAANEWHNCAGSGAHGQRAQALAAAQGCTLQDV